MVLSERVKAKWIEWKEGRKQSELIALNIEYFTFWEFKIFYKLIQKNYGFQFRFTEQYFLNPKNWFWEVNIIYLYVTDDVITVVIFRLRNDAFLGFLWLTCFFISWYDYLDVWCACWSSINLRYVFMLMSLCLRLFGSSTGCGLAVLIASTFWHAFYHIQYVQNDQVFELYYPVFGN